MRRQAAVLSITVLFVIPATAQAARFAGAPGNDNRATATPVGLPSSVSGTTVGATDDPTDPSSDCGRAHDTVWYRISGTSPGRVVVRIAALGNLDAIVAVYRAVRSRLVPARRGRPRSEEHTSELQSH